MNYSDYLQSFEKLIKMLDCANTSTPDCLTLKLKVSRRTLFRYLDQLRTKGAIIRYSKRSETYYFENNFNLLKDFL